jgi:serine/threonine protein kinase
MFGLLELFCISSCVGDHHSNPNPIGVCPSSSPRLPFAPHLSPLTDLPRRDILEKSARGDYSLEGKEWDGISADAKDLVRRMLTVDPEKRITTGGRLPLPSSSPPPPSFRLSVSPTVPLISLPSFLCQRFWLILGSVW